MQLSAVLAVLAVACGLAHAETRVVAIAPMSTLGAEDTSATTKQFVGQIESAIAALPDTRIVASKDVAAAIKKAGKPQLKVCEGDLACLAELGKLVGAQIVVAGEVGGLGDTKVVYLGATDVATAKELRSTTVTIGGKDASDGTAGAAIRLLDPDRYRGALHFAIDVTGATVYVNGSKTALSPKSEVLLPVGPQAIRITHPEYHDFVRFIDVAFGKTTEVPVGMQQYPIVEHDVKGLATNRDRIDYIRPPIWRRWYVVAPVAVVLGVVTGIIVAHYAHHFPDGACRDLGGNGC